MPLPEPEGGESQSEFMGRCMSAIADEFPDQQQRLAVCFRQFRGGKSHKRQAYEDIALLVDQLEAEGKL